MCGIQDLKNKQC